MVKIKTSSGLTSTGVIIDKDSGLVLTNSHCVANSKEVFVYWKGHKFDSVVIGENPAVKNADKESLDLCLLKIKMS